MIESEFIRVRILPKDNITNYQELYEMQVDGELAFTDTTEIRKRIVAKDLSPVELTQIYLNRIERLDTQLNSYLTVTADKALESARSAERSVLRGETLGLLHGIPISIKDSENTKDIRTTMGSLIYQDNIPINNIRFIIKDKSAIIPNNLYL